MNADQKDNLITQALILLHDTVVQVVALTFDGTSANLNTCRKSSNDASKHFKCGFEHPVTHEMVAFFPDQSHMLKLVHNCFGEWNEIVNGKGETISWHYIKLLNDNDFCYKKPLNAGNKDQFFKRLDKCKTYISELKNTEGDKILDTPRFTGFLGHLFALIL